MRGAEEFVHAPLELHMIDWRVRSVAAAHAFNPRSLEARWIFVSDARGLGQPRRH